MSKLAITIEGHTYEVNVDWTPQDGNQFTVMIEGEDVPVIVPDMDLLLEKMEWVIIDKRPYEVVFDADLSWVKAFSGIHHLDIRDLEAATSRPRSGDGRVKAPIPGLITRLLVEQGQSVKTGQPLLVLEAMKMENEIRATRDGVVASVRVQEGQTAVRNDVLIVIQ